MARISEGPGTGLTGPGKPARVMVWKDGDAREAELIWGFQPLEPTGRPVTLLRAERWQTSNPCLVVVNDFALRIEGRVRYAASLIAASIEAPPAGATGVVANDLCVPAMAIVAS